MYEEYTSSSVLFCLVQHERIQGRLGPRSEQKHAQGHLSAQGLCNHSPLLPAFKATVRFPRTSYHPNSPLQNVQSLKKHHVVCFFLFYHFQTVFVYIPCKSTLLKLETFYQKPQVLSVIILVCSKYKSLTHSKKIKIEDQYLCSFLPGTKKKDSSNRI